MANDSYSPLIEVDGGHYFPKPYSATSLSNRLRNGLIPLGVLATLSVTSTVLLISFIVHRFIAWRKHYKTFVGYNQYVVLVLNLLVADLMQGASFLISWRWLREGHILAPSSACFAQGWLLHSGDVSSGLFVLAIAVHTYYTAVYGRRVGHKVFGGIIVSIWIFVYFLTAIGVGLHGERYFVRAGAWCWVSSAYETDRLWCHYIWVFIVEFGTILIYLLTFYSLRQKTQSLMVDGRVPPHSPNAATIKIVNRVTLLMTLYPCVYVLLTLPLSSGRMWSMSHDGQQTSDVFSCIAGSLLASCGWVDSLLYTLTRKRLLQDTMPRTNGTASHDWESHELGNKGITHTRTVTVEAGEVVDFDMMVQSQRTRNPRLPSQAYHRAPSPTDSIDPIISGKGLPGAYTGQVRTEITAGAAARDTSSHEEKLPSIDDTISSCSDGYQVNRKFTNDL